MVLILIYMNIFVLIIPIPIFSHIIGFFCFSANNRDLFVGDPHEFPLPEGPLRFEICDKHLRGSVLRVERLGAPI